MWSLGQLGSVVPRVTSKIPWLPTIHWNFLYLHWTYIILVTIFCSVIIYPGGRLSYIDALYFSSGAATQSGLNPVDVNKLHTYQQVAIYVVPMITNPIFVNSFVVFVRLFWFERRFEHIVTDVKALRRERTGGSMFSADTRDTRPNVDEEERGADDRPTTVPRDSRGRDNSRPINDSDETDGTVPQAENSSPDVRENEGEKQDQSEDDHQFQIPPSLHRQIDMSKFRLPARLSPEQHIAFLENQRKEGTNALRIPGPREYDQGGGPQDLYHQQGNEGGNRLAKLDSSSSNADPDRSQQLTNARERLEDQSQSPDRSPHITIDAPDVPPARTRGAPTSRTMSQTQPEHDVEDNESRDESPTRKSSFQTIQPRRAMSTLFRSMTMSNNEVRNLPYLSYEPTVGRNSAFLDLTEEQRDELGGIEYRSLKALAVVLVLYFVCFHLLGIIALVPWIMKTSYGESVRGAAVGRPWWGVFTAASAFNDLGFTLTPDSMSSFQTGVYPLLWMSFLIIIGNTGFPCMLRFIIWIISLFVSKSSPLYEEAHFLLDHPRRCFTSLFPKGPTWWLFFVLVFLNIADLIIFIILDAGSAVVSHLSPGQKFLDGLFQSVSTRTAGLSVFDLSKLHPGVQVSYMVMIYISVLPVAISVRQTNVYEERSLGVYYSPHEEDDVDDNNDKSSKFTSSYLGAHLRRQLSFDLWYIFLGLFIIAIVESRGLRINGNERFNLFAVLFEIISAYGTVGLSLGYPNTNTSFSAQFRTISKLVMIAMELRGRHRGLPYDLDRAILLPSENLHRVEQLDAERRFRARNGSRSSSINPTTRVDPSAYGPGLRRRGTTQTVDPQETTQGGIDNNIGNGTTTALEKGHLPQNARTSLPPTHFPPDDARDPQEQSSPSPSIPPESPPSENNIHPSTEPSSSEKSVGSLADHGHPIQSFPTQKNDR